MPQNVSNRYFSRKGQNAFPRSTFVQLYFPHCLSWGCEPVLHTGGAQFKSHGGPNLLQLNLSVFRLRAASRFVSLICGICDLLSNAFTLKGHSYLPCGTDTLHSLAVCTLGDRFLNGQDQLH